MSHAVALYSWVARCIVVLVVGVHVIAAQQKPAGRAFVPGEVIVKFRTESRAGQLCARASAQGSLSDSDLSSYVESLSSDLGIPLEAKQFGSGGSVILAVRQLDLVTSLAKRLGANPSVGAVKIVTASDSTGPALEVEFIQGSPEAKMLTQAAAKRPESSRAPQAVIEKLEREYDLALAGQVMGSRQVRLTPDLAGLTRSLAARLSKRAEVEYAQPNFIRHPSGPRGATDMGIDIRSGCDSHHAQKREPEQEAMRAVDTIDYWNAGLKAPTGTIIWS